MCKQVKNLLEIDDGHPPNLNAYNPLLNTEKKLLSEEVLSLLNFKLKKNKERKYSQEKIYIKSNVNSLLLFWLINVCVSYTSY